MRDSRALILLILAAGVFAAGGVGAQAPAAQTAGAKDAAETEQAVATKHQVSVNGKRLKYAATAGMMPMRTATGEVEARIFYTSYTLEDAPAKRPLLFAFNGGPGAASVWLHLGAIGPRRIRLEPDGHMPPPPFELVENESTWLDRADLVFIDPVGTGYSYALKPENNKNYWGVQQDLNSMAEFVRLYLGKYDRWTSPLFVAGESYGTFRAAGLSDELMDRGIALSGVILVSSVLNFQEIDFNEGDDLSYVVYLPSYAATAWYHHKLPPDLQSRELPALLAEVEAYASNEYLLALARGDALPEAERSAVAERVARYSGLSKSYVELSNLRVPVFRYFGEALRDRRRTVGRYDSRFTGIGRDAAGGAGYDPSQTEVQPVFTMTYNQYVRSDLGFRTDRDYKVLAGVGPWDWGRGRTGPPQQIDAMRSALNKNRHLRLFVAAGYYDLATPYYGAAYTVSHLSLEPEVRTRVSSARYAAGHMMYVDTPSREKLKRDVAAFIDGAPPVRERER